MILSAPAVVYCDPDKSLLNNGSVLPAPRGMVLGEMLIQDD